MIRSFISLLIGGGLLGYLWAAHDELPLWALLAIGLLGLLFCFLAWVAARHHVRLIRARKSAPVAATIFIRATAQRRGPNSLVAEITIGPDIWRGTLTGWSHEQALAGQAGEGRAWIHRQTGAPLELELQGQILTPIPVVTKVRPGSKLEEVIRSVHSLDE